MSSPALVDLADRINAAHEEAFSHAKAAILRAIDVGDLLTQAKAQVKHGEWMPWVEANCRFGLRQAQKYLRAYEHRESLTANAHSDSPLPATIDRALASVAEPRPAKAPAQDLAPAAGRLRPGVHRVRLSDLKRSSLRIFAVDPIDDQHVEKLRASIREFGFWGGVVCRQVADGSVEIVDGHHRVEAAWAEGIESIDVAIADFDERQAIVTMARAQATQNGGRATVRYGTVRSALAMVARDVPPGEFFDMEPVYQVLHRELGLSKPEVACALYTLSISGLLDEFVLGLEDKDGNRTLMRAGLASEA